MKDDGSQAAHLARRITRPETVPTFDDNPEIKKLMAGQGDQVRTAFGADEALGALRQFRGPYWRSAKRGAAMANAGAPRRSHY